MEGKGGEYIDPEEEGCLDTFFFFGEVKEEWNANSPAVARVSGRPMRDK